MRPSVCVCLQVLCVVRQVPHQHERICSRALVLKLYPSPGGTWLEMQIIGPHPRPPASDTGVDPAISIFTSQLRDPDFRGNLRPVDEVPPDSAPIPAPGPARSQIADDRMGDAPLWFCSSLPVLFYSF